MATTRDYYDVLGVEKKASAAELKKAYRKKALEFHPDRNKGKDSEAKFKEINEAYEILSNPQKKQSYDQFGHAAFQQGGPGVGGFGGGARTGRAGPFTYTYSSSAGGASGNPFGGADFGGFTDPFEIFESFFGGASPFRRGPAKPHYSLKVDLPDAYKGIEKELVHQGKQYKIKIPPGADDGTRIRYTDFDVSVDVQPHNIFKRDGSDIIVDHEIPFTTAAIGSTEAIPTLDGKVKIKIRPGTQPGSLIRLRGKGMPSLRGHVRGDQYIRLIITIPKSLTREQKDLLNKFDETSDQW